MKKQELIEKPETPDIPKSIEFPENLEYNGFQEYFFMMKNFLIYKIKIGIIDDKIIIESGNYSITFNFNEINLLFKTEFNSIQSAYEYLINLFDENNYMIKEVNIKKEMILYLKINNKFTELILSYEKTSDYFTKQMKKIISDNEQIKKELNILKRYYVSNNLNNNGSNPKDIKSLKSISKDSFAEIDIDNTFTVFKSINDILYLIYSNKNKSLIFYDMQYQQVIKELKKCHNTYITNIRHYLDEINKRDLIMSISSKDNNLKIWSLIDWECILNLTNVNKKWYLYSACILTDNNENYIVTSSASEKHNNESIKVFNLNGIQIKTFNNSNETTLFVDNYYDDKTNKNYIISCSLGHSKSYDFRTGEVYRIYSEKNKSCSGSAVIKNNENIIKLIDSSADGYIRIYNFHSGEYLSKIKVIDKFLYGLCLWNNNFIFVGCGDKTIKLIDLDSEKVIESLNGHKNSVLTIKKLIHPLYGEYLLSQGLNDDKIKIWINKIDFS